jgi:hypothetical protein
MRGKRLHRNQIEIRGDFPGARCVRPGLSGRDDMWGHPVSVRGKEGNNGSGREREMGCGLPSVVGQILSPRPFYSFPISFSFLFCFLLIFGLKTFTKPLI